MENGHRLLVVCEPGAAPEELSSDSGRPHPPPSWSSDLSYPRFPALAQGLADHIFSHLRQRENNKIGDVLSQIKRQLERTVYALPPWGRGAGTISLFRGGTVIVQGR